MTSVNLSLPAAASRPNRFARFGPFFMSADEMPFEALGTCFFSGRIRFGTIE